MSQSQQKIRNASAKIAVLLKIGFIVSNSAAALAVLAICILLFSGEELRESFLSAFDLTAGGGTVLKIAPQSLLNLFVFMLADTLLMSGAIFYVHAIFDEMKKGGTPFSHRNTVRIRKIAVIVILLGVVGGCADILADYYTIGELTWRMDAAVIGNGIIIYCISMIFNYGCDLQRESDETL